ncbi:MAG: phospho-N-acetylmuramoyl-pentapeptide-transferase [Planctomycetota bacterium]
MLHLLAGFFSADLGRLFSYISFRAAGAAVTAFLVAILLGPPVIARLKRLGVGERTSGTGSKELDAMHAHKGGTPTMGGIFVVGGLLLSSILWLRLDAAGRFAWPGIVLVAGFSAIGLRDDWIKLHRSEGRGMGRRQKQAWLSLIAAGVAIWLLGPAGLEASTGPHLYLPFFKDVAVDLTFAMGLPFLIVSVLVLTGSANAVNLTDGLDGLAAGCIATAAIAYAGITYFVGHAEMSQYLLVQHVAGAGEMTVMMGALLGASLGFLWFNAAPALVFMGDVGSLGLGGALGYAALVSRTELVLFVVGGVFVAEAVSVILQIASCRLRGKRVFKCAPLHHHFRFQGVPETRVVVRAWVVSALLALTSLALFKVR